MKLTDKQRDELNSSIKFNMDLANGELFASQEKKRLSMGKEKKRVILLIVLLAAVFILGVLFTNDLFLGFSGLPTFIKQAVQRVNDILDLIFGNALSTGIHFFLIQFAAPVIVGMALAASGACYQGLFHNPMASPTLLGVTSGGMIGSAVFVLFFSNLQTASPAYAGYGSLTAVYNDMSLFERFAQQLFIMAGCFAVIIVVLIIAKVAGHGKISVFGLMLGGSVFSVIIDSALNLAAYILTVTGYSSTVITQIRSMLAGQFTTISNPVEFLVMAVPIIIPLVILLLMSNRLNVIAFGEDEAKAMGINVERSRIIMILLTTIMTGVTVAFCGQISFVGLLIPQLARIIVGNDYKYLLPASAVLGGLSMLLGFILYYTLNFNLSVGAYVNTVGAVAFLIFMIQHRRSGHADWT